MGAYFSIFQFFSCLVLVTLEAAEGGNVKNILNFLFLSFFLSFFFSFFLSFFLSFSLST
jgi:hypothetical protein